MPALSGSVGDRGLARRPARLRRVGDTRRRRELRAAAERIARPAQRHRRVRGDDADPRLRERAVAGRRRRDRALPRWPLRVRRGAAGRRDHHLHARRRDRPPAAAGGRRGLPARRARRVHPRDGHRLAVGDRGLARRDVALRDLERRHADLVPAQSRDGDADAAAPRRRLPERRGAGRLRRRRRAGAASAVAVSPDGSTVITTSTTTTRCSRSTATPPGRAHARILRLGPRDDRGCTLSAAPGRARARSRSAPTPTSSGWRPPAPTPSSPSSSTPRRALGPTAGTGGCLRRLASPDCRAARALDDPRGLAPNADGTRVFAVSAQSDGIAVLGPQLAPNCLPVRASTVANQAHSVVLACSDPNGDKSRSRSCRQPQARPRGRHSSRPREASPTRRSRATPAPTRSRYTATDGLDVSAPGTATVSVTLPPKAPARPHPHGAHAPAQGRAHPRPRGMPADRRSGPAAWRRTCSSRASSKGYGFSRLKPRTTGRIVRARTASRDAPRPGRRDRARQVAARHDRRATILILP